MERTGRDDLSTRRTIAVQGWLKYSTNFRSNPKRDGAIYAVVALVGMVLTCVCFLEPYLSGECEIGTVLKGNPFLNPLAGDVLCSRVRRLSLLGLTELEATLGRRLFIALALGALVGTERRKGNHPAGLRTNACVAVGACCYTICSTFAFESGSMKYDASRSAAQVPAGITFLASAIIFKKMHEAKKGVAVRAKGIMTAASVWVSASIGTAVGGNLYWTALFCALLFITIARFGKIPVNY
ncbi:hypothetical protein NDN08_007452 [Rhodosorus marinus]|uniref:MgtC/SapB/SrpB/YhiD N-terminal domain-containing protein n=1 Tax=Rhodosorus marinus TaxID=101924 RepID=A0AAV8UXL1_9RHOD|nr:hypothetical protein NDN08_007452 [Rhodosorus marinus]